MPQVRVAHLSYEHIRSRAESFLEEYHPVRAIPIPIERIVEFTMRKDIVPLPGLREIIRIAGSEVEGFTTSDLKEIVVDEWMMQNRPHRYRFTLGHEVGHIVLHREIIESNSFKSIDDWKKFLENFPEDQHEWYEYQAYAFAGLVLVPARELRTLATTRIAEIRKSCETSGISYDPQIAWDIACDKLAADFDVSSKVIMKRIEKDDLRANLG